MSIGTTIDRVLGIAFPGWAARRINARVAFDATRRAYEGGVNDRLSPRRHRNESIVQASRRTLLATRSQARELYRTNPHAHGLVDSTVAFVIGCGIRPQARVVMPKKFEPLEKFNDKADSAWKRRAYEEDFYKKQRQILREKIVAGECFVRLISPKGREVPLGIDVIKSERVALLDKEPKGGNKIIQGIEVNSEGKRVAYHIFPFDPGDNSLVFNIEPIRVPADEILHIYDELEPGQIRGLTRFLPCAGTLEALAQYQDLVLTKERVAASLAVMVTQNNLGIATTMASSGSAADDQGNPLSHLEGGMFWYGRPGEDIKGVQSGVQSEAVDKLTTIWLRQIARGFNSSYELLSRDLSQVSYLSARQGENHDRRHWEPEQEDFNNDFNEPIWREFIRMGALAGAIPVPEGGNLEAYSAVQWVTDGWDWIDPSKDVAGDIEAIKAGLLSPQEATAKHGRDWFQVLTEKAAHESEAKALGLTLSTDLKAVAEVEAEAKAAAAPEPKEAPEGAPKSETEDSEEAA